MTASPPEAELTLLEGFFDAGRPADVVAHGEPLLARFPESFVLAHMLGTANGMLGRDDRAAEHFRQAVQAKPDFYEAHLALGLLLARTGHIQESRVYLEKAAQSSDSAVRLQALKALQ